MKLKNIEKELENVKEKEKEQRVISMQAKNELFVTQKNGEIEIDALKSQLTLKQQHLEQSERENSKAKIKYEKEIE